MPADEGEEHSAAVSLRAGRRETDLNRAAAAASAGEPDALERFLQLVRQPVLRYCRGRIGASVRLHTAEDVAQEVLMAVCEALPRYRPSEVPAMAFIYGIARNKVADSLRSSGRDRSDPTDAVPDTVSLDTGPEAKAVRTAEVMQLRTLLDRLPEAHREVLVMRIAMQFSAEETARVVGSTSGAVRVTQHRALAKLRAMLAEQMADSAEG